MLFLALAVGALMLLLGAVRFRIWWLVVAVLFCDLVGGAVALRVVCGAGWFA